MCAASGSSSRRGRTRRPEGLGHTKASRSLVAFSFSSNGCEEWNIVRPTKGGFGPFALTIEHGFASSGVSTFGKLLRDGSEPGWKLAPCLRIGSMRTA